MDGCHISQNSFVFSTIVWPTVWTTITRKHGHLCTSPSEDYMDYLWFALIDYSNVQSAFKNRDSVWRQFKIAQSSQWLGSSVNKRHEPSVSPSAIHLISAPGRCPLTSREVSELHAHMFHSCFQRNIRVAYMRYIFHRARHTCAAF